MQSPSRIFRRRSTSAKEGAQFKKDNQPEHSFFNESSKETFFKPANAVTQTQSMQRKCADCEKEDKQLHRMNDKKEEEKLHRMGDKKEEEKKLQKKDSGASNAGTANTSAYISSLNGKGNRLPKQTEQFFSSRMGCDFSGVKIHTDKEAADSAKDVNAKAYTIGNNIVFSEGQYNTESAEGKKLLAHELTHVVQQNTGIHKKIMRYSFTHKGKVDADKEAKTKMAMDDIDRLFQKTLRAIQSILINGEKEPNRPVANALKAFYHCPTPKDTQAIFANLNDGYRHFKEIETIAFLGNEPKKFEAEYDDILKTLFIWPPFFDMSPNERMYAIIFRILWPLFMNTTTVEGQDFADNFSIPGEKMVANEYSMEYFMRFIEKPRTETGMGKPPCINDELKAAEKDFHYTNTGHYVIVPRIITPDTYLKHASGFEAHQKGDIVGELLNDQYGNFIFYKSQRIYVDENNKVKFPF